VKRMKRAVLVLSIGGTIALAVVLAGTATSTALAASPRTEHCVAPNGIDINANLDISAAVVASFCPEMKAGDSWVRAQFWTEAKTWEQVPDGFVPAGATPLEDFVAKFVAIRYVVDQGTSHEFAVEFATGPSLWTDEHPLNPDIDLASAMTLGTIRPLSVGPHTVTSFWIFSDVHCDGMSSVFEESCVPAGAFDAGTVSFDVVPK
jgi:hypothetical protein